MRAGRATAWAAGVLMVAVCAGPPAQAAVPVDDVECGDVLTGDHRLTRDLHCDGLGLTLVERATLDLGGHTLDGGGSGAAIRLLNDDEEDNHARMHDGVVRGWAQGVRDAHRGTNMAVTVDRVTFEDITIVFDDGDSSEHGMAVWMTDSTVTGADVVFELGTRHSGLTVRGSHLERNEVVVLDAASAGFEFIDSVLVDNTTVATVGEPSGLIITDSHVSGSREVVSRHWQGAALTGSTFVDNDVVVAGSERQRWIDGNTFLHNGLAVGAIPPFDPDDNRLGPTEVVGNTFRGNHDAIVTTVGADASIGHNVVTYGSGWGIHAPGATDLGGNQAWGNARSPQCTGVVCRGRS